MINMIAILLLLSYEPSAVSMVSPYPGSDWQSPDCRIIVNTLDGAESIDAVVFGSISGPVALERYVSADGHAAVFTPEKSFQAGETVSVEAGGLSWEFSISPFEIQPLHTDTGNFFESQSVSDAQARSTLYPLQLPYDFPGFQISSPGNPAPGFYLFAPFNPFGWLGLHYIVAMDNQGEVLFYRHATGGVFNAEIQRDSCLCYGFLQPSGEFLWFEVDPAFRIVDSYSVDGYSTDEHDMTVLNDDNVLLMGFQNKIVDMSQIVPGGNPDAVVRGLIIQIQDRNHMPIFNWNSFDYIPVEEAATYINLTAPNIDYVHCNSLEEDTDGNLIFSGLSLCSCVKIDRVTGEILWRLGGTHASVNDFTIIGDPLGAFNSQHDFKASGPGTYTMFDNGTWHSPKISRGLEYEIDTDEMTATLIWSYSCMDYYGTHLGSMQTLPGGNRILGWGDLSLNECDDIHEVDQDAVLQTAVRFTPAPLESYRAYKYQWDFQAEQPYLVAVVPAGEQYVQLTYNVFGDIHYPYYRLYTGTSPLDLQYHSTTELNQTILWNLPQGMNYFAASAVDSFSRETGLSNIDSALVEWTQISEEEQEELLPGRIFVTPNPCMSILTVFLPGPADGTSDVGIYDMSGRMISPLKPDAGELSVTADITTLPSGLYFIRFRGSPALPSASFIKLD
jgi:hypothetical protein